MVSVFGVRFNWSDDFVLGFVLVVVEGVSWWNPFWTWNRGFSYNRDGFYI